MKAPNPWTPVLILLTLVGAFLMVEGALAGDWLGVGVNLAFLVAAYSGVFLGRRRAAV
jgi:hypothetical protein